MRAFEVYLNGKKLCLAGIGDDGVLTAIVTVLAKQGEQDDLHLQVGGLVSPVREHITWVRQQPLHVSDEIRVKIVETKSTDRPTKKDRIDPAADLRNQKKYVRLMAKKFGWKIQAQSKRLAS